VPGRVADHAEVSPRLRVRPDGPEGDGYFFPREAVAILGAEHLDYRQIKRLFRLARTQAGLSVPGGWSRFSLLDLAAMRVALDLATPGEGSSGAERLQLAPVERACEALRRIGVANPLLDVRMERMGRRVFAVVDGEVLDPTNGQMVLAWSQEAARSFLIAREDGESVSAAAELARTEPMPRTAVATGLRWAVV
jgi:hypothetical protein